MIQLFFKNASDTKVVKYLAAYHQRLFETTMATNRELMEELMARIKEKLSGEVLQQRTKKLEESVKLKEVSTTGTKVIGTITVGEGLGKYPLVQEYGGRKHFEIVPRTKQALAFFPETGRTPRARAGRRAKLAKAGIFFQRPRYKAGRVKPSKFGAFERLGGVVVKRVERDPLPARSYVRSAVRELEEKMIEKIRVSFRRSLE